VSPNKSMRSTYRWMLPVRHLCVFVAYNTGNGGTARNQFSDTFFDHYVPRPLAPEAPPPKYAGEPAAIREQTVSSGKKSPLEDELHRFRVVGAPTPDEGTGCEKPDGRCFLAHHGRFHKMRIFARRRFRGRSAVG
jgi:hypothetical protein